MGTIADKLELLRRTKERQREYLQKKYPLLDFDNIPFRAYLDLFQGRSYVPGFVLGVKAYGRSNNEDASTRDILPDYSGNGRDIKLYNFGWTEDSGYNTTTYPGALVSDGVDDYGQCIKDFALPDDYTVVAIRKIPKGSNSGLASKGSTVGAFLFEAGQDGVSAWSYGKSTYFATTPALFSYQMKNSYNGTSMESGTATDTEEDKLYIFKQNATSPSSSSYILYDLRIYDHSLTAEELQTVKDEMMTDYENATGGGYR